MALISLNSAILGQLDRVVVSAWLPLAALGVYGLASQLAQTLVLLVSPLSLVLLPWFTQLVELKRSSQLEAAYHKFSQLAAALAAPTVAVLGLFPEQVLIAWTGDPALAAQCGGLTAVLAAGSFCLAMQVVPYCLSLAHGWTSLNVALGFASLLVFTPLTAMLASRWGAAGCAWGWLGLHATTLLVYVPLLHARLLPGRTRRWCAQDIGAPALAAVAAGLGARWITPAHLPAAGMLAWLALVWLLACLAACAAAPAVRPHVFRLTRRPLSESDQPGPSPAAVIRSSSRSTST
jgi:O-antigen/teichoic acid export membrane protein